MIANQMDMNFEFDKEHGAAIHIAAEKGNLFLKNVFEVCLISSPSSFSIGHQQILESLITKGGVNVNSKVHESGKTPLHVASFSGMFRYNSI